MIVRLVPRRLLSRLTGWFARRELPGFLLRPLLRWYARRYGADLADAVRPLEAYTSFVDFFTRELHPEARPMPEDPRAVASPCDGTVSMAGSVEAGTLLQVKGHTYALADLLGDADAAAALEGGTYAVIYLAPGDYHRYHWPFDGTVTKAHGIEGDLWPVNERAVNSVPGLFARNARVACTGRLSSGGTFAYVPVGALNVGSIQLVFSGARTNPLRFEDAEPTGRRWGVRGEEFGRFELGSTVVLVLSKEAGTLDALPPGTKLRMGEAIGRLL
ncbi:MAG: archaetidylserine decarboxylase [Planctomycetota bacterium]|nr:archaetidylserine decarboxylase [Planctomycetota bacterium]